MQKYRLISSVFVVFFMFFLCDSLLALDTARIDVVRSKQTLNSADNDIIEDFVSEAFAEFMATEEFASIASVRNALVSRKDSEQSSGQIQYNPRFLTAAQKQIVDIAKQLGEMPQSHRKSVLAMNLMITIGDLGNVEIAKEVLGFIDSPDVIVRYWAVKALLNQGILEQLNYKGSAGNEKFIMKLAERLKAGVSDEKSPEVLAVLAQFGAAIENAVGGEILTEVAKKRIAEYNNWSVANEMVDSEILRSLAEKVMADAGSNPDAARSFALLYSSVIQRYYLGRDVLPEENVINLSSVITQTEKRYLPRLISDWQGTFKRAIEKDSMEALLSGHDALFGTSSAAGKLPSAFNFDYGKAPDGSPKTAPAVMTKPPEAAK